MILRCDGGTVRLKTIQKHCRVRVAGASMSRGPGKLPYNVVLKLTYCPCNRHRYFYSSRTANWMFKLNSVQWPPCGGNEAGNHFLRALCRGTEFHETLKVDVWWYSTHCLANWACSSSNVHGIWYSTSGPPKPRERNIHKYT